MMGSLRQELFYAVRQLRKSPGSPRGNEPMRALRHGMRQLPGTQGLGCEQGRRVPGIRFRDEQLRQVTHTAGVSG